MIDLSEITGEIKTEDRELFLARLTKLLDRMGDPFKLPDLMAEWLHEQHNGVDIFYAIPVGYGALALQLRFTFKKNMIIMEFLDPMGARLMEIRLHD